MYALAADATEVTQVENVVGPLLFAVAWFGLDPPSWGWAGAFLSGLAAGVVLLFKLVFLPVIGAMWLVIVVIRLREHNGWRPVLTRIVLPAAIGCAIPLAALAWYIVANDLVDITRFTFIEFPPQEAQLAPRPIGRLLRSLAGYFVPLLPFLVLAGYRLLTGRDRRGWPLSLVMAAWLVASVPVFAVQPWWSYYLYLGFVPLGILAAQGLDDAIGRVSPRALWPALVVLVLPALALGGIRVAESVPPLLSGDGVAGLRTTVSMDYDRAIDDLAAVPGIAGSAVYVLGDPLILYLGDAAQAVPVNGWSPEYWTGEIWDWVIGDLEAAVPEHVFISDVNAVLAAERSPAFLGLIDRLYERSAETPSGTWYRSTG
jgi:hypothetical protein